MPRMNGFAFLAWRKASPLFSSIRVVIFSGLSSQSEVRQILELGANKHIAKPTGLADWEKVVREIWDFGTEGTSFLKRKGTPKSNGQGPSGPPVR
jgi:CheY-like chemotaxis protein